MRWANLRQQASDRHLPLMVLNQHERRSSAPEMTLDAGRQRCDHRAPSASASVRAVAHDSGPKDDVLHDAILVNLEARTGWHRDLDDPLLVDDPLGGLVTAPRRGLSRAAALAAAFSMPLGVPGLMSGRPFRPFSRAISSPAR